MVLNYDRRGMYADFWGISTRRIDRKDVQGLNVLGKP